MTEDNDYAQADDDQAAAMYDALRDWYERQPPTLPCGRCGETTHKFGARRVCGSCGYASQDGPVERAQLEHPDAADAPTFDQEFARTAARRQLDEQREMWAW